MNKWYWSSRSDPTFYDNVHYTLAYGSIEDCQKLINDFSIETVRKEFLKPKYGFYSRAAFGYAQMLLGVKVDYKKYIKDICSQSIR